MKQEEKKLCSRCGDPIERGRRALGADTCAACPSYPTTTGART